MSDRPIESERTCDSLDCLSSPVARPSNPTSLSPAFPKSESDAEVATLRINPVAENPSPTSRRATKIASAARPRRSPSRLRHCLAGLPALLVAIAYTAQAGAPGPEESEPLAEAPTTQVEDSIVTRPIDPFPPPPPATNAKAEPGSHLDNHLDNARKNAPRPVLDPSARMLSGDDASEAWTLYVELESGHRITQRFLLVNAGPGDHNAVALGHLHEPGRPPYRYQNGRTRANWNISDDRLFMDIAASHLDLHRPNGELRITKKEIEIRLFFDFPPDATSARIPSDRLPRDYNVEVLAVGATTRGSIQAPWMSEPLETRGRTWLVHTWTKKDEAELVSRRTDLYGYENGTSFYGLQIQDTRDSESAWHLIADTKTGIIESRINHSESWREQPRSGSDGVSKDYPTPRAFEIADRGRSGLSGPISLGAEFLRFDPTEVIPQPFRWFIQRNSKPQEVWATARIGVRLPTTPGTPPLPAPGETLSATHGQPDLHSKREIEEETAERSVTGVASITFLNPSSGR